MKNILNLFSGIFSDRNFDSNLYMYVDGASEKWNRVLGKTGEELGNSEGALGHNEERQRGLNARVLW
jgi:hypothetical protein